MRITVTGANGFIGKNLCIMLEEKGYNNIHKIYKDSPQELIEEVLNETDFIFHFAGVNRTFNEDDFFTGNFGSLNNILSVLTKIKKSIPIVLSSSTQVNFSSAYSDSKLAAENLLRAYAVENNSKFYIYRLPNIFGKWCKPNYNSFIATFCHNIVNGKEITIHNVDTCVSLVYIDDLCKSFISLLEMNTSSGYVEVSPIYESTVGEVASIIKSFPSSRDDLMIGSVGVGLERALYSTYLSYKSPDEFSYSIPFYADNRGHFCEMLKTKLSGQFSFFTALPGNTRGGHYHHTKNEKFLVVKGRALFKFEHIITGERHEITVDNNKLEVVESIPGWAHDITNVGSEDLIVFLWANETYNPEIPDTITKTL